MFVRVVVCEGIKINNQYHGRDILKNKKIRERN